MSKAAVSLLRVAKDAYVFPTSMSARKLVEMTIFGARANWDRFRRLRYFLMFDFKMSFIVFSSASSILLVALRGTCSPLRGEAEKP